MVAVSDIDAAFQQIAVEDLARRVGRHADYLADSYRVDAPRDTGQLADAFRYGVETRRRVVRLHAEVDDRVAPHGKWIDQPVDEIVPVRAKALRWFGRGGEPVFAQRVVPSREHEGWWMAFINRRLPEAMRL